MKRLLMIVTVAGFLSISASAQVTPAEIQTADLTQSDTAQTQQLQQRITDLYLSDFRNEVQLSDEQFLKLNGGIRNFMQNQFQAARRRQALKQQLDQLMSQPNPSETDVQRLIEARNQFERESATMETRFLNRMGAELSPGQQLRVMEFNRRFMNEKLPDLVQRARERAINPARNRQQQAPPVVRPNANRPNANRPN